MLLSVLISCGGNSISEKDSTNESNSAETEKAEEQTEIETRDVFAEALGLYLPGKLTKVPYKYYGNNCFKDYSDLHGNPTSSADYVLDISSRSKNIDQYGNGISSYIKDLSENFGFKRKMKEISYETYGSSEDALKALFNDTSSNEYKEAISALKGISEEVDSSLAEFLSAAIYASNLYIAQSSKVNDTQYNALYNYSLTLPATDDPSPLNHAYEINKKIDSGKLMLAGTVISEAAEKLSNRLRNIGSLTPDEKKIEIETPLGNIILGSSGDDYYKSPKAFLIADTAGNDRYTGSVAASISKSMPISVVIDIDGNDTYDSSDKRAPSQGTGIFGAGILFDLNGNDIYSAYKMSQGAAMFGLGILFDGKGNDTYSSVLSSQASVNFGFALLADKEGDDKYHAYAGSQAHAGNQAMAFLVDLSGDDDYSVEQKVKGGYGWLEYSHGYMGNWSQGCGAGNRSVSTTLGGLSGGIAGLIDHQGNDTYLGSYWVQGVGYWSGIGFVSDMDGNDKYTASYYSQASVAHFGIGILTDINGNDRFSLSSAGSGAGLGFVWDRGVAFFANDGGNDVYVSDNYSFGSAWSEYDEKGEADQDLTYAFFIDTGGEDVYSTCSDNSFGWGLGGFFIDTDGYDSYQFPRIKNNFSLCDRSSTQNGVFIDTFQKANEPVPVVAFWERAKSKILR